MWNSLQKTLKFDRHQRSNLYASSFNSEVASPILYWGKSIFCYSIFDFKAKNSALMLPRLWMPNVAEAFQAVSTRLWPSLFFFFFFFFFFFQVCYWWPQKNDLQQFSDFFENFPGSNGRNRREIRAVIDSFEIDTINSLIKKKFLKLISSCPELYFG